MVQNWAAGNKYEVGEVVIYQGFYYKNIQAHTSQNDWTPDKTADLWGKQGKVDAVFKSGQDKADLEKEHEEVEKAPREAKLSHELIAGAAAFQAARMWEHHKEKNGEPPSHPHAKELIAGFAGAFVDRIVETKGLDFIDKQKAKKRAQERAEDQVGSNY
ncbi:hypothetical protein M407DRAFT_244904 [Tulasnella calospora MUT 4182]|uniref:Chitin-binding type-3 domain-containing protein n=1 Tax=Tulasnella calospora MUT 4182 TaxID=1051891 RepID=A0A0C3LNY4_9AGAM|nr:hypothetical protein M407DRAFT_244904 [Tulasnella calospora MUT 4182]